MALLVSLPMMIENISSDNEAVIRLWIMATYWIHAASSDLLVGRFMVPSR